MLRNNLVIWTTVCQSFAVFERDSYYFLPGRRILNRICHSLSYPHSEGPGVGVYQTRKHSVYTHVVSDYLLPIKQEYRMFVSTCIASIYLTSAVTNVLREGECIATLYTCSERVRMPNEERKNSLCMHSVEFTIIIKWIKFFR